jgi:phosphoribosylformylglycinamidine synthase
MSEPSASPSPKPAPFPGDLPIDAAALKKHKISPDEYAAILKHLGREPSYTELGVFSVMWSEHCSYKSSRVHLKRLPTKGPRVIQGPGENAGVVDIGDGFAAVFKMESHNHPSFIEPYQGAATGVGGILRDVFTMGARPIAGLNSLRFGRPDHPRTSELLHGVVAGIGGYGNCIGVPTVGGELAFDASYDGNILVNAFTCGVARTDRIFYGKAEGVGNSILYIGAKTGRDGIHGATMASDEFSQGAEAKTAEQKAEASAKRPVLRSTMQVGDPFMGKILLEACLELFAADVLVGIQDMGAAGLTSSSVEMAGRSKNGIELDLDKVPRRAKAMLPYEILLSESQERMLLVAKPGHEQQVLDICSKWELDAAIIGRVTSTGRWVIKATPGYDPLKDKHPSAEPVVVCDLPTEALTDAAPVYDRPRAGVAEGSFVEMSNNATEAAPMDASVPEVSNWTEEILRLVGSPNVGSRAWVWRQYDQIVRGGTEVRPGSDAGVVRVPCERDGVTLMKHLAFAVDCHARHVGLDPFQGAAMAVAEVCRNLVCSGAEPIGLTDCLNFGSPERPAVMTQIAVAIDGIAAACHALAVPVVSGNVSLYNETDGRAILPTPGIAAVGLLPSDAAITTSWFKAAGDVILLLGKGPEGSRGLSASEWLAMHGRTALAGDPPVIDLAAEKVLQTLMLQLTGASLLASAHDVSDGGMAAALCESCTTSPNGAKDDIGARIDLDLGALSLAPGAAHLARATALFGEAPTRILVSVKPGRLDDVRARASKVGVPVTELGVVGGTSLSIAFDSRAGGAESVAAIRLEIPAIRASRESCLDRIVGLDAQA